MTMNILEAFRGDVRRLMMCTPAVPSDLYAGFQPSWTVPYSSTTWHRTARLYPFSGGGTTQRIPPN